MRWLWSMHCNQQSNMTKKSHSWYRPLIFFQFLTSSGWDPLHFTIWFVCDSLHSQPYYPKKTKTQSQTFYFTQPTKIPIQLRIQSNSHKRIPPTGNYFSKQNTGNDFITPSNWARIRNNRLRCVLASRRWSAYTCTVHVQLRRQDLTTTAR